MAGICALAVKIRGDAKNLEGSGEGVGKVPVEDGRDPVWFISDVQCPGRATRQTLDAQPTIRLCLKLTLAKDENEGILGKGTSQCKGLEV